MKAYILLSIGFKIINATYKSKVFKGSNLKHLDPVAYHSSEINPDKQDMQAEIKALFLLPIIVLICCYSICLKGRKSTKQKYDFNLKKLKLINKFDSVDINEIKHSSCPICLTNFSTSLYSPDGKMILNLRDKICKLECNHFFHSKCLSKWIGTQSSCPTCRFEIINENKYNSDE